MGLAAVAPISGAPSGSQSTGPATGDRQGWWCFQPIVDPLIPEVQDPNWSAHPIDRFIQARLEQNGLRPARAADPQTIARRASFALTGLPPTSDDIASFTSTSQQDSQAAMEQLIHRMISSRHFGERWARHWMDLVRYADTYGSEHDYLNPYSWRYRDYLIRAFAQDLPYDRFIEEQLAGDLLESPRWNPEADTNESLLGTAYQRMVEFFATPVDVKHEEVLVIDWQIETLSKTFLGLTVACARCHDHKFDPISTADFYSLYGVFAGTRPTIGIIDDPARLTRHDAELDRLKHELRPSIAGFWRDEVRTWPGRMRAAGKAHAAASTEAEPDVWVQALFGKKDSPLKPLGPLAAAQDFSQAWNRAQSEQGSGDPSPPPFPPRGEGSGAGKSGATILGDFRGENLGSWRVSGPGLPIAPSRPGLLSLAPGDSLIRAVQPAGYYSDAVTELHGGSLRSPEFVLDGRPISVLACGTGKARLRLVVENHQGDLLLFATVNPDLNSASPRWITMPMREQWLGCRAHLELLTRDDKTCVGAVKDVDEWSRSDGRSWFGIVQAVMHDGPPPRNPAALPRALWEAPVRSWDDLVDRFILLVTESLDAWEANRATDGQVRLLQALLEFKLLPDRPVSDSPAAALAERFRGVEASVPVATRAPAVCDDGTGVDSPIFVRGDHRALGPMAPRRWLGVLGGAPLAHADSGRLGLARELTSRNNPLTARVMANRIWQHLMGRGLVASPDNFGRMGELPTHPELLDHLATRFMNDGWSIQRLISYIMTSRTWQLSCVPSADAIERDPNNELLSHAHVRRLDAESIRDAMLAVAGNLHEGHEGPNVRLYYHTQIDPDKQPAPGPIDGGGRRSIYLETRRLLANDFLAVFDCPRANTPAGRRAETNVPAQALTLLNDPFVHHQAQRWAQRVTSLGGTEEERVAAMYLAAFGRVAQPWEIRAAGDFLRERRQESGATADDTAPWQDLAHTLLNTEEFIFLR